MVCGLWEPGGTSHDDNKIISLKYKELLLEILGLHNILFKKRFEIFKVIFPTVTKCKVSKIKFEKFLSVGKREIG